MEDLILKETKGNLGIITLNRLSKLNALSLDLLQALEHALTEMDENPKIKLIILKGGEKVFCAGGDLHYIYDSMINNKDLESYFKFEFYIDNLIEDLKTPTLSYLKGIVMGGGVGLSLGTKIKVVDETTKWAMPETRLGMFPDVGVGYFFSSLEQPVGLYLSLMGETIFSGDLVNIGFTKFSIESCKWDEILEKIASLNLEKSTNEETIEIVENLITPYIKSYNTTLDEKLLAYFRKDSLDEILKALRDSQVEEVQEAYKTLMTKCPLSLFITYYKYFYGKNWTRKETYKKDLSIMMFLIKSGNMVEGIKRIMIDKTYIPQFTPPLNKIRLENIKYLFS